MIDLLYGDKVGEPLGEERMRELIEAADSEKLRKAAERLHAVVTARAGVLSDDNRCESVREPSGGRSIARRVGRVIIVASSRKRAAPR